MVNRLHLYSAFLPLGTKRFTNSLSFTHTEACHARRCPGTCGTRGAGIELPTVWLVDNPLTTQSLSWLMAEHYDVIPPNTCVCVTFDCRDSRLWRHVTSHQWWTGASCNWWNGIHYVTFLSLEIQSCELQSLWLLDHRGMYWHALNLSLFTVIKLKENKAAKATMQINSGNSYMLVWQLYEKVT